MVIKIRLLFLTKIIAALPHIPLTILYLKHFGKYPVSKLVATLIHHCVSKNTYYYLKRALYMY